MMVSKNELFTFKWFYNQTLNKDPLNATGISYNDCIGKTYQLDEYLHPTNWIGNKTV